MTGTVPPLPAGAEEKLAAFESLVARWNRYGRLVARGDVAQLRHRHTEDSLRLLPWVTGRLADIGAGAGFPSIPLAIATPQRPVVLIERSVRKCRFLRQVVIDLALSNVEVFDRDVRELSIGNVFDSVTARAVAPPVEVWPLVRRLLKPSGRAILQSGARLAEPSFDGGEVVDTATTGRGWITVVQRRDLPCQEGGI